MKTDRHAPRDRGSAAIPALVLLAFCAGSAARGGATVAVLPQEEESPTPAEREWNAMYGKIAVKLVEFKEKSAEQRTATSFQEEVAALGSFFRKYRDAEPDFAWSARVFLATEILAGALEQPRDALQILFEVVENAPGPLVAQLASLRAAELILSLDDEGSAQRLRQIYEARENAEPQVRSVLESLQIRIALRPDRPFPDWEMVDRSGQRHAVRELRGSVVLVFFFSVEHDPSMAALPRVARLAGELEAQGLAVLGVSLDEPGPPLDAALEDAGVGFPVACDGLSWDSPVARQLGIGALPASFLLDRSGIIRAVDLRSEELGVLVRDLVAERPPAPSAPGESPSDGR